MLNIPVDDIPAQLADLRSIVSMFLNRLDSPVENRLGFTVEEVAATLGKSAFTVREWCRLGRINGTKRSQKRGGAELWNISSDEVTRIRNEGLLPPDPHRNVDR